MVELLFDGAHLTALELADPDDPPAFRGADHRAEHELEHGLLAAGAGDDLEPPGTGLVVPTSRATAIAALLRHCILEWGVPEAVRTDEGKDYTSRHVLGVLADLEIEHRPCPPYTPEAKPFVERFLGTLTRDLFATLPGFSGHDVAQAQARRSRKSFATRRAERARIKESGEDDTVIYGAALSAEELQARCVSCCDTIYGRWPHSGLGGISPFARRASWAEPVRQVHDERALDALLAEPAGRVFALPCQGKGHQTPALTQAGRTAKAGAKANKAAVSPTHTATSASLAAAGALFLKDEED